MIPFLLGELTNGPELWHQKAYLARVLRAEPGQGIVDDGVWPLAHFVAVSRPGHRLTISGLPEQGVSSLEVPALAISSTDCRRRVSRGFPVWYLVPDGVVQYISKHHLYRS